MLEWTGEWKKVTASEATFNTIRISSRVACSANAERIWRRVPSGLRCSVSVKISALKQT